MRHRSLRCDNCGGTIAAPASADEIHVVCNFCGNAVQISRPAKRQPSQKQAQPAAASGKGLLWAIIGTSIFLCAAFAGVTLYRILRQTSLPTGNVSTTIAELQRRVAAAQTGPCGDAFVAPTGAVRQFEQGFTLASRDCARFIGMATGPTATLTMRFVGGDGQAVAGPPPAQSLDYLYCPRHLGGTHKVIVSGAATFGMAGLACKRDYPTDPEGVGANRVAHWMKERHAAGCKKVLLPAQTYKDAQTFSANFNAGTCVEHLVATGMSDNDITLEVKDQFGDIVAGPNPSGSFVFRYCVERSGAYTGRIEAALQGPYTLATVGCPKSAGR